MVIYLVNFEIYEKKKKYICAQIIMVRDFKK